MKAILSRRGRPGCPHSRMDHYLPGGPSAAGLPGAGALSASSGALTAPLPCRSHHPSGWTMYNAFHAAFSSTGLFDKLIGQSKTVFM